MIRGLLLRFGVFLFVLVAMARATDATAAANYGQIVAAQVIGDVDAINQTDQAVTPLHNGDGITQGYTVRTADEASVVLVFSNGATLRVAPKTELVIEEFLQDPFAATELAVAKLAAEPSKSSTRLRLLHGEIDGQVARLQPGSTHIIRTPVGAAGIRGTTFRHVYQINPNNGNGLFTSATDEGTVVFTSLDGQTATIGAATELTGHARLGRRANVQFVTREISRRSKVVIDHHVRIMNSVKARVIFRRADARPANTPKPAIRRDAAAARERVNDLADIEREEQEKIRQEQQQARAQRQQQNKDKTPKASVPKAKKN